MSTVRHKRRIQSNKNSSLEESLLNKEERAAFINVISPLDEDVDEPIRCYNCGHAFRIILCNSGAICIIFMIFVFLFGIALYSSTYAPVFPITNSTNVSSKAITRLVSSFIIYGGVFGVLGGFSNILVLVILFYKIPLLCGTGVIERQHSQISDILRKIVLQMLFDNEHLERYFLEKINRFSVDINIVQCITRAVTSNTAEKVIDQHLDKLYIEPEAYYLNLLGVTREKLKPMVVPALLSLCAETAPLVLERLDQKHSCKAVSLHEIREAMDGYLRYRVNVMTRGKVAKFIRVLTFQHFFGLVGFGSLTGLIIGIIAQMLRFIINPEIDSP